MPEPVSDAVNSGNELDFVEALAGIAQRMALSEIEVTRDDFKVRVTRQVASTAAAVVAAPAAVLAISPQPGSPVAPPPAKIPAGAVKSPMVGTAYLRASPDAQPFVRPGAAVNAGDKVLLIEAMKTFNDIVAPRSGVVTAVMVEDGQPVEYDQALIVIE